MNFSCSHNQVPYSRGEFEGTRLTNGPPPQREPGDLFACPEEKMRALPKAFWQSKGGQKCDLDNPELMVFFWTKNECRESELLRGSPIAMGVEWRPFFDK